MFLPWVILFLTIKLLLFKVYQKLTCGMCKTSCHLFGKTVIVTGANTGIGYETAKNLAERGARVILACRSETRGEQARDEIAKATKNSNVIYKKLDLASLASVRAFAEDILKTEKRLDVLINNAGAGGLGNYKTADGLQVGMQVNYFAPYLLTRLMEPLLKKSAPSRIVTVSSSFHKFGELDFSNLNMKKRWTDFQVYVNSKLCNNLMTLELSRRLEGSGVVANCLHPGVVATDVFRNIPSEFVRGVVNSVMNLLFKSCWEGAQTSIYLAVAPEVSNVNGKYFSDCHESVPSAASLDEALARKLWDESERLVKFT